MDLPLSIPTVNTNSSVYIYAIMFTSNDKWLTANPLANHNSNKLQLINHEIPQDL